MLLALAVAPLALVPVAALFRRWRAQAALARIPPGQVVVFTTIALSRRR